MDFNYTNIFVVIFLRKNLNLLLR